MTSEVRWHLTYSDTVVAEPIVSALTAEFGLVTNIRRADVRDHVAWVILDVHGDHPQLDAARAWLEQRGLHVSVLTQD